MQEDNLNYWSYFLNVIIYFCKKFFLSMSLSISLLFSLLYSIYNYFFIKKICFVEIEKFIFNLLKIFFLWILFKKVTL